MGNTNLTLFSLPFDATFYLTTEKQTLYNANSFSLSFDPDQFKRNLEQKIRKRIKEKTEEQYKYKNDIKSKEAELKKLDKQFASKEKALENKKKELNKMPGKYADQYKQKANSKIKNTIPSTNDIKKPDIKKIEKPDIKINGKDSIPFINGVPDSLYQDNKYLHKKDSLAAEIEKMEAEIEKMKQKIELVNKSVHLLKHSDPLISKELKQLIDKNANPNTAKGFIKDKAGKVKGIDKVLSAINNFDVGIFNPMYTNNSLWGITVKGVNTSWTGKNFFGNATIGNTYRDQLVFNGFATQRPHFDRRVLASMIGYGDINTNNVYIIGMGIKDKPKYQTGINNSRNIVGGFGGQLKWKKYAALKGECLYSLYEKNIPSLYNPETTIFINDTQFYNPKIRQISRMSINLTNSIFPTKNLEIKTSWKYVGPGYRSLGAPYIRTNFEEREIALKWKVYKNKLSLNGFYKTNRADPLHYREGDYKMSGFGLNARTNFKKYPNLFLSYSPYEQGNNSPDTQFRSNNKFSILTSGLSYRYKIKKVVLFSNALFTRSHTEFRQLQNRIGNQYNFTFSQSVQCKKIMITGLYALSRTNPSVDSLNNFRLGSNVVYTLSEKVQVGVQYDGGFYQNGSYIQQGGALINYKPRKAFLINLKSNVGKLKGLYGVDEMTRYDVMIGVEYRW